MYTSFVSQRGEISTIRTSDEIILRCVAPIEEPRCVTGGTFPSFLIEYLSALRTQNIRCFPFIVDIFLEILESNVPDKVLEWSFVWNGIKIRNPEPFFWEGSDNDET